MREKFEKIVKKYNLTEGNKLNKVVDFILGNENLNVFDFAKKFDFNLDDAKIFLNFINNAIKFKQDHIDANQ